MLLCTQENIYELLILDKKVVRLSWFCTTFGQFDFDDDCNCIYIIVVSCDQIK